MLGGFLDDPRIGLVCVLPAGHLLLRGFALFGGFRFPVFFQLPFALIFHGNRIAQSGCQSERGWDSNCTITPEP